MEYVDLLREIHEDMTRPSGDDYDYDCDSDSNSVVEAEFVDQDKQIAYKSNIEEYFNGVFDGKTDALANLSYNIMRSNEDPSYDYLVGYKLGYNLIKHQANL